MLMLLSNIDLQTWSPLKLEKESVCQLFFIQLALQNALRYFPCHHHATLAAEFAQELRNYGHIYMYRFCPAVEMKWGWNHFFNAASSMFCLNIKLWLGPSRIPRPHLMYGTWSCWPHPIWDGSLFPRHSITANAVEGLAKSLHRMTSGECLVDVWRHGTSIKLRTWTWTPDCSVIVERLSVITPV